MNIPDKNSILWKYYHESMTINGLYTLFNKKNMNFYEGNPNIYKCELSINRIERDNSDFLLNMIKQNCLVTLYEDHLELDYGINSKKKHIF